MAPRPRYAIFVLVRRIGILLATLVAVGGCKRSWSVESAQPRMFLGADPITRTSTSQSINLADMHLPSQFRLPNTAKVVLVTKDRIRARVRFIHRWQGMTDMNRWKAWLEDDEGNVLYPSAVEKRTTSFINELVVPDRDQLRRKTGFVYRIPVNLYDGGGDYVFYRENLYRRDLNSLTLVLQRRGYQFRYTWHFVEDPEDGLDNAPELAVVAVGDNR